jgi:4a-hydroxytetrahydrobiopterin dehydratase
MSDEQLREFTTRSTNDKLTAVDIKDLASALGPQWRVVHNSLMMRTKPASMIAATLLVQKACEIAEELQHHPDIELGHQWLRISITTHDQSAKSERGLTRLDSAFAARLELARRA